MENRRLVVSMTTDDEKTVRDMIRHEDDMMNHRITWLTTSQGLLFTALAFAWDKEVYLVYLLSVVGLAVGLSSLVALNCTRKAVKRLYERSRKGNHNLLWYPDVVGYLERNIILRNIPAWVTLPIIFTLAWSIVGVAAYYTKGFP